jgi:hypothetical protein
MFCTLCGSTDNFKDGCKFALEIATSEVEMSKVAVEEKKVIVEEKKVAVEEKKIFYGTISSFVTSFVVYVICFIFIAVIYLGFDNVKIQMSQVYEECRKGGWLAAISHILGRR